jgi:hypothetical protein
VKSETTHRNLQKRQYFPLPGLLAHYTAMTSNPQDSTDAFGDAHSASGGEQPQVSHTAAHDASASGAEQAPREIGGREGPEPTRFGDWEKNGRCIDF